MLAFRFMANEARDLATAEVVSSTDLPIINTGAGCPLLSRVLEQSGGLMSGMFIQGDALMRVV